MSGNKNYTIKLAEQVIKKDIPLLPKTVKGTAQRAIEDRLQTHPIKYGKPLKHSLKGHRRIKAGGSYRIVYRIDEENKTVYIVAIKHRKDVYKHIEKRLKN